MLNVRLACDHLFGKLLFTWLSLVMSMMVSFVLSFFPRDVLDEILNLIESVSEEFPSYSWTSSTRNSPRTAPLPHLWTCLESLQTEIHWVCWYFCSFQQSWCNHDICRLSKRKKRTFRKARATKKQADWNHYKKIQKEASMHVEMPMMTTSETWLLNQAPTIENSLPTSRIWNATALV